MSGSWGTGWIVKQQPSQGKGTPTEAGTERERVRERETKMWEEREQ